VEGVFERDIVVRTNIVPTLDTELHRLRERAPVSVGSGISDAYQPVETRTGIMREAAAVLHRHAYPASILTKSASIVRDLELWSAVHHAAGFNLYMSLVFADDAARRIFEPGASPVEERLRTLSAFKARGCGIGVYAMPLLPWITDTPAEVDRLLGLCVGVGVDFVQVGGLTLRPGRQKELFLERLGQTHPDLVPRYRELYGEERASGVCLLSYRQMLNPRLHRALERHGLASQVPHRLYRGRMPLYDELHLLLCHMVVLYGERGSDTTRLRAGLERYRGWLVERKRQFNRRRRQTSEQIEGELCGMLTGGGMRDLLGNDRLAGFLRSVGVERRFFDYPSLKLL
jgi:DNA repair photolyase